MINKIIKKIKGTIKKADRNTLIIVAIIVGLVIVSVLVYNKQGFKLGEPKNQNQDQNANQNTTQTLSAQEVADKIIKYTNENLLQPGITATFVSVEDANPLYKIKAKIQTTEYTFYATKDGKLFFPSSFNLDEQLNSPAATEETPKATCETLKKSNKALLEAFVVSNCPYGLQMQRILNEIAKNIPSLTENIKVRYIGVIEGGKITSMHGDKEAQENLRQICIREEQSEKYWDYTACYMKKGEMDNCLASTSIDQTGLASCMSDSSKGLKYAQEDFNLANQLSVSGSPTLFLNGEKVSEFDFGGRKAEAVKNMLCCGFNTTLDICYQKLSEDDAAASFSETYSSVSGAAPSASCGQ